MAIKILKIGNKPVKKTSKKTRETIGNTHKEDRGGEPLCTLLTLSKLHVTSSIHSESNQLKAQSETTVGDKGGVVTVPPYMQQSACPVPLLQFNSERGIVKHVRFTTLTSPRSCRFVVMYV